MEEYYPDLLEKRMEKFKSKDIIETADNVEEILEGIEDSKLRKELDRIIEKMKKERKVKKRFSAKTLRKLAQKLINPKKEFASWDYGLSFVATRKLISKVLYNYWDYITRDVRKIMRRKNALRVFYLTLALVQLVNGARSQEAMEGLLKLVFNNPNREKEVIVKVRKKKENPNIRRQDLYRKIVLPNDIHPLILDYLREHPAIKEIYNNFFKYSEEEIAKDKKLKEELDELRKKEIARYHDAIKYYFGFTPHSLRHSFSTYLIQEKGISPYVVAKITKHSDIKMLLRYFSQKEADKVLEDLVRRMS